MLFDDRLATVLRHAAQSEAAARTQYRQLLDLLGTMPAGAGGMMVDAAYARLGELADILPAAAQSAILRAPGLRIRSEVLAAWLSERDPQVAAAAMATAELDDSEWERLIPRLSMTARGFLRHRRGMPPGAQHVLERLGVGDLVLPQPETPSEPEAPSPSEEAAGPEGGIGALVRRIEAFQRSRREPAEAPRLPLGDLRLAESGPRRGAFDFASDAEGTIVWADPAMAPLAVGLRLTAGGTGATAVLDERALQDHARRLPLRAARICLDGPAEIAGDWRLDAMPSFTPATGAFSGYHGRMRRIIRPAERRSAPGTPADRMRQLLHELRTPVGAIQGFAELIQQQMFGPTPNEYRALAAAIAVDAARLLAGFDEVDRLARLESGTLQLGDGRSDLRDATAQLLRRLEGVLRPHGARIDLTAAGGPFTLAIDVPDAQQLLWRLLATIAGSLAAGETIGVKLTGIHGRAILAAELPAALIQGGELFLASVPPRPKAVSAGMFGSGFALRLARAEAMAAGGALELRDGVLCLDLPVAGTAAAEHDRAGLSG